MWTKPWTFKEGIAVAIGLISAGFLLQLSIGPVHWAYMSSPVNVILLVVYICLLILVYALRKKVYAFQWAMGYTAAVPALVVCAVATMIYGITNWSGTLSCWPFVLIYIWITVILGLTSIHRIVHFKWGNIPFLLNHLGLFIAIVSATLGSADMRRLRMEVKPDMAEWRAFDVESKKIVELPIAIQLNRFTLDEYPAKLLLADVKGIKWGEADEDALGGRYILDITADSTIYVAENINPEGIIIEDTTYLPSGMIDNWDIKVEKYYEYCACPASDTVDYVQYGDIGATTAALVRATDTISHEVAKGWISNGSFMFRGSTLRLNDHQFLMMPEREPRKYVSDVEIYTESGKHEHGIIEVNKPYDIEGWKIYQLSYDGRKGRWSDISILELVKDPWLPFVYTGIYMLIAGAVWMFVTAGKRKEEEQ